MFCFAWSSLRISVLLKGLEAAAGIVNGSCTDAACRPRELLDMISKGAGAHEAREFRVRVWIAEGIHVMLKTGAPRRL